MPEVDEMHPDIKEAVARREEASAALREVLRRTQEACAHARVIQSPWRSSEYGPAFRGRRLCLACGLEEEASGLSDSDHNFTSLKTGGFHKVVTADVLFRTRFPLAEVNGPIPPGKESKP